MKYPPIWVKTVTYFVQNGPKLKQVRISGMRVGKFEPHYFFDNLCPKNSIKHKKITFYRKILWDYTWHHTNQHYRCKKERSVAVKIRQKALPRPRWRSSRRSPQTS